MFNVIIHPEYEKLYKEVKSLKEEITKLISEKDELVYHTCKNIMANYMMKIGVLEYKAFEFQCKILRLKRKITLMLQKINKQEKINMNQIEKQLDQEYKEYMDKLNNMADEMNKAIERVEADSLSNEDAKELKRIYREIVKKLHPDLNPDVTEENKELLMKATKAYEDGSLETIKVIQTMLLDISPEADKDLNEFDELLKKKEKYEKTKASLIAKIKYIKESFPYNQIDFLEDEEKVKLRREELNTDIKEYKQIYNELKELYKNIKDGNNV